MITTLACSGELEPIGGGTGGGGGAGGAGGAGGTGGAGGGATVDANTTPPPMGDPLMVYMTTVEPIWDATRPRGTCRSCHQANDSYANYLFLGLGFSEGYRTLTGDTWSRLLACGGDIANNGLANRGAHSGDALEAAEIQTITDWITLYCSTI